MPIYLDSNNATSHLKYVIFIYQCRPDETEEDEQAADIAADQTWEDEEVVGIAATNVNNVV